VAKALGQKRKALGFLWNRVLLFKYLNLELEERAESEILLFSQMRIIRKQ